jgi:hypothetical protein
MRAAGISTILTLNKADLIRYRGIVALTPTELLANWPAGLEQEGLQTDSPQSGDADESSNG